MRRGELRWYTFAAPDKRWPVLLLTRDAVIESLNEIIAVPATRTIRGLSTEVLLSPDDRHAHELRVELRSRRYRERSRLGAVLTTLPGQRWPQVEKALLVACGFEPRGDG